MYVYKAVDESTLLRNSRNININNHFLSNISFISINSEPIDDTHVVTKTYVDSLSENHRSWRDSSLAIGDQYKEFDIIKWTNLDRVIVERNLATDNELSNKKLIAYKNK